MILVMNGMNLVSKLKEDELLSNFLQYFNIFPINQLNNQMEGFDLGCIMKLEC